MSVRLRLTLSYAALVMVAGALLLAVVYVFLLRYVPAEAMQSEWTFFPGRSDLMRAFVPAALWALAFLLAFALLGGWFLAGRMLAPLRRITVATRRASTGELSHRIRLEGRDDEFRELADSFDTMLARLEAHVAEQQRFAANASHELRTPLAITRTMLDVAQKDPHHDHAVLLARLQDVNVRATELTEALLLLSRADRRSFTRERVDLSLHAESAAETLLPLAEQRGVAIAVDGELVEAVGSPALLLQLTTNLIHNAIVHNLASGGSVRVTTGRGDVGAQLVVESTGAEIPAELLATLTEPFQRGERIRTDHSGVGLGLAIVKSIVAAHDGRLLLDPRRGGGLRVTVQLPAAAAGRGPGHADVRPQPSS